MTQEQFIKEIAKYVQKYATQFGIAVHSPIIAQAVLESASGTSELAINANNYFGLKYNIAQPKRCPSAIGYYVKDGAEQNSDGSYTSSTMLWQKFKNMEDGVRGYFEFLNYARRYDNLKGVSDPKQYLELIKSDGYATSIKYVDSVYNVITKYNLTQYDNTSVSTNSVNIKYKIAIDAGHGYNTAGKRTPDDYREHVINVKSAYYCEQLLKKYGFETVRIGWDDTNATDDADIPLVTRQNQIKNAKCDYSVSFHANAHGNGVWTSANGVETLIHNNALYAKDSLSLATKVQNRLIQGTKQNNRGVKKQALAMCNCVAMNVKAACLVEIGFMTNKEEAALMKTEAFCKEQGEDVAKGILDYLSIGINENITTDTIKQSPEVTISQNTYIVQKGDTLAKIGSKAGVPWNTIAKINGIKIPYIIKVGQVLKLTESKTVIKEDTYSYIEFIKDVQRAIGVKVDGVAGNETLSKTITVSSTINRKHPIVKPIQKYLNLMGYDCGAEDGIAGSKFTASIKMYQKANNCVVDGEITAGKTTWKKLLGVK